MKLIEALNIVSAKRSGPPLPVGLVCGFTPLHLQTFLHAELQLLYPERKIQVSTGLYGDVSGTLREARTKELDALVVVIEWEDLDARLGLRRLGGWRASAVEDILQACGRRLSQWRQLLLDLCARQPVVISLPTLSLPPLFLAPGWREDPFALQLKADVASFAASLAGNSSLRLLNQDRLGLLSPEGTRSNVRSDWAAGFPYHVAHASIMASMLARLVRNEPPSKGIITDLDNTLWSGIVGEVGPNGVYWDLDHMSQAHGLYQQMLALLLDEGILIGVASKNDLSIVQEAFAREDLVLDTDKIFPLEVSWGTKAGAVSRILKVWNIGAESVVFIDDSPLELAEVEAAHPAIKTIQFEADEPDSVYQLLWRLRDLFGKGSVSEEDRLRLDSIRRRGAPAQVNEDEEGFSESLLEELGAELVFSLRVDPDDIRAFELVNKTNQFNLNGRRFSEADWRRLLTGDDKFMLTASYSDRFGSLGKIAVMVGRRNGTEASVDSWVMSCRAFARRIEHQCLNFLFQKFKLTRIVFAYEGTQRNGPLTAFFSESLQQAPHDSVAISLEEFKKVCPRLFHEVKETDR